MGMRMLEGLERRAILIGTFTALGLGLLYMALMVFGLTSLGWTLERTEAFGRAGVGAAIIFGVGVASDVLGGYAAAKRVAMRPVANAAAVGALLIVVSLLFWLVTWITAEGGAESPEPWRLTALSYVVTIPATMLGGWTAARRRPRQPAAA